LDQATASHAFEFQKGGGWPRGWVLTRLLPRQGMHPETQRQLEAKLNKDEYTCATFCKELPYHVWNTCPLCLCGLLPVLVVIISAICQLDYATQVTDVGAQIINKMGLSYTVYYTAGCWPQAPVAQPDQQRLEPPDQHCNEAQFEIAAGEYDALSGSLLRVRNVTDLHAKQIVAVKVTPDWRFITFIGSLANDDLGNLYAIDAQEEQAKEAVPLLSAEHLKALNAQCELHSESVLAAKQAASTVGGTLQQTAASLTGFRQLQVIIPDVPPLEFGGDFTSLPVPERGTSLPYRAAFSIVCKQPVQQGAESVEFSKIAVLDFLIRGMNITDPNQPGRSFAWAESALRLVDTRPKPPRGANDFAKEAVKRFHSQSCPRFVPSKEGSELIYVAEDVAPAKKSPIKSVWHEPSVLPSRLVAQVRLPSSHRRLGNSEPAVLDDGDSADDSNGKEGSSSSSSSSSSQAREKALIASAAKELTADSQVLDIGQDHLPLAPVSGCPEFVSDLYKHTQSLSKTVNDDLFKSSAQRAADLASEAQYRDTFVALSDPSSSSVLDVDAQVLSASLPSGSITGEVMGVRLLYNVQSTKGTGDVQRLVIAGCKPIRAAGRQGHMRMQYALETVMETLKFKFVKSKYTAWLACLTADQRVAIVESPKQEHWINMSMPFPGWTGKINQPIWCPREHQESCFEVWSNPNPNE